MTLQKQNKKNCKRIEGDSLFSFCQIDFRRNGLVFLLELFLLASSSLFFIVSHDKVDTLYYVCTPALSGKMKLLVRHWISIHFFVKAINYWQSFEEMFGYCESSFAILSLLAENYKVVLWFYQKLCSHTGWYVAVYLTYTFMCTA